MSKSGTWPGNMAMESLSNMDSAGSCDSVISTNSVWSQDSMEHLSPEEKACLMYLEETIEALEMQEDSGLSNDEPDLWSKMEPNDQLRRNDVPIERLKSGIHKLATPTTHAAADPPPTGLTTEHGAENHTVTQDSKPQGVFTSVVGMKNIQTEDLKVETNPLVSDTAASYRSLEPEPEKKMEASKLEGDPDPENANNSAEVSNTDLEIIPPPTDFMDEPDPDIPSETVTVLCPPANNSIKQKTTIDLEQMRMRASVKKSFVSSLATEDSPSKPLEVAVVPQMSPPSEFSEPRSPPAVAPKPKKLPANILLKSQKTPTPISHGNQGHLVPAHSDRVLLDPQKVRFEALRKLGLLKDNEEESNTIVSPKLPLKSAALRGSQSHSPLVSPVAPHTPTISQSLTPINSAPPTLSPKTSVSSPVALQSVASASPPIQDADILPAPAAFSDLTGPSGSEPPPVTEANFCTPPHTPPVLPKQLTPSKGKSATLERSGLSRQMYGQDPKQLHNTRPRPASLGSGKDFSHTKGEDLAAIAPPDSQKVLPTQAFHHRESAKLPRSQGISVLISPRPENEENRREALKKLGLLRD